MLGVLTGTLLVGGIAQAATSSAVSSPTLAEKPDAVTTSSSATFRFTGPSGTKFSCALDTTLFTKCTSPMSYRGLSEGGHSFAVKATVGQAESSPAMWSWTVDSTPPQAPVLTAKPIDPTYNATNFFEWTGPSDAVAYQCSEENGAWKTCSTPHKMMIPTSNYGLHQFAVRSVDAAGNTSAATTDTFKYQKKLPDSGVPFTITGQVDPLAIGVWQTVRLTITNPNSVPIFVSALNVGFPADSTPSGCSSVQNIELQQSDVSPTKLLQVPADGGSVSLPAQGVSAPRMRLVNLPNVNQDVCKNKTFDLSFSGTATN